MSMLFLLMILLHIIDDFVLQPVCLSKLKQKSFWTNDPQGSRDLYRNDYKAALLIHGLSWSVMIHLPLIVMQLMHEYTCGQFYICCSVFVQALMHAVIDNFKANQHSLSLIGDQLIHLGQLCLVFFLWYRWIYNGVIMNV